MISVYAIIGLKINISINWKHLFKSLNAVSSILEILQMTMMQQRSIELKWNADESK